MSNSLAQHLRDAADLLDSGLGDDIDPNTLRAAAGALAASKTDVLELNAPGVVTITIAKGHFRAQCRLTELELVQSGKLEAVCGLLCAAAIVQIETAEQLYNPGLSKIQPHE